MVYLFVGQDSFPPDSPLSSKDTQLKQIKEEFLTQEVEEFNLDILYAETLKLPALQERLLSLPVNSPKRIIVIKNAQELAPQIEDFVVGWAKQGVKEIILLLDIETQIKKEAFLKSIQQYAKVFRFKEVRAPSTFNLTRQIEQRKLSSALKILEGLLKDGERPERILGGLRYALENSSMSALDARRKVKWLLECDIEIKTGRLKPVFALEKLIVKLCGFVQPFC